jgi:putative ABC transport system permease protein
MICHTLSIEKARGAITMRGVWHDLRYGVRQLRQNPGFTAVAVVSLALGIGANTAIFSVVNGVLLRPLPYDQPDKVVHILGTQRGVMELRHSWLAYPEIEDVRAMNRTLAHVAAFRWWDPVLYGRGEPVQLAAASVSASYFEVFGVRPALGRFFLPEEDELGHAPVVVLSYGFWQQMLGGDPRILGTTLELGDTEYTVIGVAPADFVDPFRDPGVWRSRPADWDAATLSRLNHSWRAIARLRDGVTQDEAQADQDRIWGYLAAEYPEANADDGAQLMTAQEYMVGSVRRAVIILLCAVGLVLLIACANVANLYLTRTVVRAREVALRSALGAGRGRIVRQLLTEVCLLFLLAGAVGLYLAWVGLDALLALGGENLPRLSEIRIDSVVLGFTLLVSLLTAVVFGLTAAYRAVRTDLAGALQVVGRGSTGDRATQRLRGAFIVAEIALTLILLAGGGLLLKSLWNVRRVEPGFRSENLLTLQVSPRSGDYDEPEQLSRLYTDILDRVTGLPGVRAVGAINLLPMSGGQNCEFVWRDDQPLPQPGQFADYDGPTCLEIRVVSPNYFRAMGIPVRRGRAFTARDDSDAPPVAILNESAAALAASLDVTSGDDVLGKRVTLYETRDRIPNVSREVVGVVGDVRDVGLSIEPTVIMYVPHAQELDPDRRVRMTLVVRTQRHPTEGAEDVRAAIWGVDERLSISRVQAMSAVMNRSIAGPRFRTTLLLIFGAVALLLAAVGVAGVVGYAISQRIPEIGLRIALGAQTRDIYTTVMSQGIRLTVLGLALGLVGALAATRALSGLVYGISPSDPPTYLAVSLLMVSIALLAIWVPARSALRVDPVKVLNAE